MAGLAFAIRRGHRPGTVAQAREHDLAGTLLDEPAVEAAEVMSLDRPRKEHRMLVDMVHSQTTVLGSVLEPARCSRMMAQEKVL